MKRILVLITAFTFCCCVAQAQQTPATQLANRIATKMKDTLNLNDNKRSKIYDVNMRLHNQKLAARQQYNNPDTLRVHLQMIENKRDSLYHIILPEDKYLLYKQKKRNLVTAN